MNYSKDVLQLLLLSFLLLFFAWLIDFYLPHTFVVSALYAIPIVLTAYRFGPRMVGLFGFIAIATYTIEAFLEHGQILTNSFGVIGLIVIAFLSIQIASQRIATRKQTEEAEAVRKQLQTFVGMVSHDLAQPLTSMKMYLQLLEREMKADEKHHRIVNGLDATMHQMSRLIQDLHDTASAGSGTFTIKPKRTDIVPTLRRLARQYSLSSKDHTILLSTPKKLNGVFDTDRLQQLFSNLISNALKYSPKGGTVTVTAEKHDRHILIRVTDQGIGMTPEQMSRLFRPFSREYAANDIKGTGLGLYICKAIAKAHGGDITVESSKGEGSTFTVSLPSTRLRSTKRVNASKARKTRSRQLPALRRGYLH